VFLPYWVILTGIVLLLCLAAVGCCRVRSITRSANLFRSVAEGASDGLVVMERDSKIIWHNAAYARIMGYQQGALVGRYPLTFALPPHQAPPTEEALAFRFDENEERFGKLTQVNNIRKDGTEFIHEFSHAALRVGSETRFLLAGRDITERVAREQQLLVTQKKLEIQSRTDSLTGLSNRAYMQTELQRHVDKQLPFAVLHIDVNRMKQINDTFGHLAGDAVLKHVSKVFQTQAKPSWLCARVGGDEFVVLMPEISVLQHAVECGQDLVDAVSKPFDWRVGKLTTDFSIGAAVWEPSIKTVDALLSRSDVALYEAKSRPDQSVVGFDEHLRRRYASEQQLERDIVRAVQSRRFTFHFQPIFNIDTRRVDKFEMLVRWRHPERGLLAPGQFLPILIQLGLTNELDKHVLSCAEKALARFDAAGLPDIGLSVNLSADALLTDTITDLLIWMVECGRIDPSRLSLEILESTVLTLAQDTLQTRLLSKLRNTGFRVFLDDFGMGYAGLAHLASFPFNGLKIDRGLSSAVDTSDTSRAIVVALVKLAHELGLDVVTEGVENEHQMEIIRQAGCAVFQGYAVARPMPLKRALEWAAFDVEPGTGTTG